MKAELNTNANRLPHPPHFLCIFSSRLFLFFPSHPPPPQMISFVLVCLLLSLSLSITPGIQLARIAKATTQNDAINYLGRDYAIKRISISLCIPLQPSHSTLLCGLISTTVSVCTCNSQLCVASDSTLLHSNENVEQRAQAICSLRC